MSDVDDDIIDREASPAELARVATIIASDPQFAVFRDRSVCHEAAAARPEAHRRHPDEPAPHGERI
jgi:hypothetical protein